MTVTIECECGNKVTILATVNKYTQFKEACPKYITELHEFLAKEYF